jgi:hypothetical protein
MNGQGWRLFASIAVALVAGLVVTVLLLPWGGGVTTDPPQCFSMFRWWSVPCAGWVAPVAGVATAALVGIVLWVAGRRRDDAI